MVTQHKCSICGWNDTYNYIKIAKTNRLSPEMGTSTFRTALDPPEIVVEMVGPWVGMMSGLGQNISGGTLQEDHNV